jgi:hypothetical protein
VVASREIMLYAVVRKSAHGSRDFMSLTLFGRALWRFRWLLLAGAAAAVVLSVLSYYRLSLSGGTPKLTPRATQVWQATASVLLTQPGFPEGGVNGAQSMGRFIGLAPLYAHIANGTAVENLIRKRGGPLRGTYQALPAADTSYGSVSTLPALTFIGSGDTPGQAITMTRRSADGFITYLDLRQKEARIPVNGRVDAQILNVPGNLQLIVPRKKTLPIVVFLGVLCATIAVVFALDNARPTPGAELAPPAAASPKDYLDRSA